MSWGWVVGGAQLIAVTRRRAKSVDRIAKMVLFLTVFGTVPPLSSVLSYKQLWVIIPFYRCGVKSGDAVIQVVGAAQVDAYRSLC